MCKKQMNKVRFIAVAVIGHAPITSCALRMPSILASLTSTAPDSYVSVLVPQAEVLVQIG